MCDILLVGLSNPEANAIEILLHRRWPSLRISRIPRDAKLKIPELDTHTSACYSCVIDLGGVGLRTRCENTEATLVSFLNGRSAIVLSHDHHGDWPDGPLLSTSAQPIIVVRAPYTSTHLLAALTQVVMARRVPAKTNTLTHTSQEAELDARSSRCALETTGPGHIQRASHRHISAARNGLATSKGKGYLAAARSATTGANVQLGDSGIGLCTGAFVTLLRAFPQLSLCPLITIGEKILAADEAISLHFQNDVTFIASVRQGWLASGVHFPMLLKMFSTTSLLDQMVVQPLSHDEAGVVVRKRYGGLQHRMRHPLDTLVWDLVANQIAELELQLQGSLHLRLTRLPNFTRLNTVGPLDVQLAVFCTHATQSLGELARHFPGQEQDVYRFAVLSILSGVGRVMPDHNLAVSSTTASDARPQGFFKSLLDRLF